MTSITACFTSDDEGHLKAELQTLRRKGALRPSADRAAGVPGPDPDRTCGRCRVELGRVINRGAYCRACRLRVCKACREYTTRTTDWVCIVCHKHMEIQVASGEWMNEFVRRPSRRRDNRVYVPAADIIKRTIRRSWTISNPTPRWSILRSDPEFRPYSSLPRAAQNISAYSSLASNRDNAQVPSPLVRRRRSPTRRTRSEDIYEERTPLNNPNNIGGEDENNSERPSARVNPLVRLAQERKERKSPKRKSREGSKESRDGSSNEDREEEKKDLLTPEPIRELAKNAVEKRVSFDNNVEDKIDKNVLRAHSFRDNRKKDRRPFLVGRSLQDDHSDNSDIGATTTEVKYAREDNAPIELCDIEPLSGTVFRKVTVRRRRQDNMRKIPAVDSGWRRTSQTETDLPAASGSSSADILLPSCDDYRLVFVGSSDGSSREDEADDSSSTASSFPPLTDECDWDYFEPGAGAVRVVAWGAGSPSPFGSPAAGRRGAATTALVVDSPLGSPLVCRRRLRESDTGTDEDTTRLDSGSPASSDGLFRSPEESTVAAALRCFHLDESPHHHHQKTPCHACGAPTQYIPIPVPVPIPFPVPAWSPARLKSLSRNLWPYSLVWPALYPHANLTVMPKRDEDGEETASASASSQTTGVQQEQELSGYLQCENRYVSSSDPSRDSSDSSDTSREGKPHVRRVYNVSGVDGRQSDDALPSSDITSDCDGLSQSSVREDDMSSSGSADTDSDDTGTVADQKPKRFSRIFVVNKNMSSSSNECSSSSDTDTSDNDTDTERDCTVILTNVKQIGEDCVRGISDGCDNDSGDINLRESEDVVKDKYIINENNVVTGNDWNSNDGMRVTPKLDQKCDLQESLTGLDCNEIESPLLEYTNVEVETINENKGLSEDDSKNLTETLNKEIENDNETVYFEELPNTGEQKATGIINSIKNPINITDKEDISSIGDNRNDDIEKIGNVDENNLGISIKTLLEIRMPNKNINEVTKKKRKVGNSPTKFLTGMEINEQDASNVKDGHVATEQLFASDEISIVIDPNKEKGSIDSKTNEWTDSETEIQKFESTSEPVFNQVANEIPQIISEDKVDQNDSISTNNIMQRNHGTENNKVEQVRESDEDRDMCEVITEPVSDMIQNIFENNSQELYSKINSRKYDSPVVLNKVDGLHITDNRLTGNKCTQLQKIADPLQTCNKNITKLLENENLDRKEVQYKTEDLSRSNDVMQVESKLEEASQEQPREYGSSTSTIEILDSEMVFKDEIKSELIDDHIESPCIETYVINVTNISGNSVATSPTTHPCKMKDNLLVETNVEKCNFLENPSEDDCVSNSPTSVIVNSDSTLRLNELMMLEKKEELNSTNQNVSQDTVVISNTCQSANTHNLLPIVETNPTCSLTEQTDIPLVKSHIEILGSAERKIDLITKDLEYTSSSPGLSDVSAESLNSSDVEGNKAEEEANGDDRCTEWNDIVAEEVGADTLGKHEVRTGATQSVDDECSGRGNGAAASARYTSLVMITQEPPACYQQVSVVTTDTTTLVEDNDVVVRHTNWQEEAAKRTAEGKKNSDNQIRQGESVTVITGGETLSAFEEGLADDDSWVENLSHEEEDDDDEDDFATNSPTDDSSSGEEVTLTCSAAIDQEDELRGYHRTAIDFTLHTIVEESCEESEVEQNAPKLKERPASATDLEKYFFFGLGDGNAPSLTKEDAFSETSSIYSEGMESLGGAEENQQQNDNSDPAELASSRLEKYFLSGFMGFTAERRDSDGSVGSDSEGKPSPEQRRKRLVRARGTGRSHSSSLDNLDNAGNDIAAETQINSENSSSSDSDTYDEVNSFEKSDGQFDTVKRKKGKKHKNPSSPAEDSKNLETTQEVDEIEDDSDEDEDGHKTPQPENISSPSNLTTNKNQQSRDSGFVGSCDDLLKDQRENHTPELPLNKSELKIELENIAEEKKTDEKIPCVSAPPTTSLSRKDSFNNWSSDEETNLMMSKMRQFFKTMVANSQCNSSSKPTTPNLNVRLSPKPLPSPRAKSRNKPPQLVYFENELTRLMKTVPGLRDDQVREIVEYLSSEDTWSDSYDSSDYTSSDLEGASTKSALQQQISDSCKQIINKFDTSVDDEGDEGDGGIIDESHGFNKETAFVYQKLVASFEKMATGDSDCSNIPKLNTHSSPPLIAKVMHHIGSRLVALMHEVSSGESHTSNSPKTKHYHRRLQHKLSSASSTTTEDDCPETNADHFRVFEESVTPYNLLPRSRSHDLLVGETRTSNQSGVSDPIEEREASDCERFSWRGSFESALLATDSRNKLSLLGGEGSASASALAIAAKRRSAGDLLFSHKSLSREQLDRVRSCGSIGGANSEDKLWVASTAARPNRRRSSVPDATSCGSGGSADGEDEDEDMESVSGSRSTLPRSLQGGAQTTNSLPRLPTNAGGNVMQKSQSMYHFLPQNVKSARYRPPGFSRLLTTVPKRAVSAPGLQPSHQRRGRRSQQQNVPIDDVSITEAHSSPTLASRNGKSATPSPVAPGSRRTTGTSSTGSSQEWHCNDDDIDRLVGLHGRSSLSSLGLRSDSMASVYSGAGGEGRYGAVTVRGQVEFGLQYNYKAGTLEVQVGRCRDLAAVDAKRGRSDPYVKAYLLPDRSKGGKRKTKVKKHTLNPIFDECLKFHISLNGLETRTLWLTVWHSDMFGRNDFLGEVLMALENKVFDDPTPKWYNLQERTEPFEDVQAYKGDIIVCLKFVPPDMTVHKKGKRSRGALHVLVKEAKSLTAVKANGTSDPFCKSYLLPDKGRSSKQKTPVARRSVNPVWNYTFVYDDITLQELAERCLELTVWDHDRLASNEFLGGVRFSLGTGKHYGKPVEWMDAAGKELSLWKSMLEKPNFWVEGCLSLRPTLDTRPT